MLRLRTTLIATLILVAAGCGGPIGPETGSTSAALNDNPRVCPAIAILCINGYHAKQLPNCNVICVPDQGDECVDDADCTIYCFAAPCPVGRCLGGSCHSFADHGGHGGPPPGSPCKPKCAKGWYCTECKTIDGSSAVCMPEGAAC